MRYLLPKASASRVHSGMEIHVSSGLRKTVLLAICRFPILKSGFRWSHPEAVFESLEEIVAKRRPGREGSHRPESQLALKQVDPCRIDRSRLNWNGTTVVRTSDLSLPSNHQLTHSDNANPVGRPVY